MALGDLQLTRDEFYDMIPCDFIVKLDGVYRNEVEKWRHTRALIGKDGRHLVPLPGDFEELNEMPSKEKIEQMLRAKKIWQT